MGRRRRNRRWLTGIGILVSVYAIALQALLALIVLRPGYIESVRRHLGLAAPELTDYYYAVEGQLRRLDANLAPGRVIVVGDSHVQGLDVAAISPEAVNFGIGGDTTRGVLERLPDYRSLAVAKAVVVLVGVNDFAFRGTTAIVANFRRIISLIPDKTPLYLVSVPPVDQAIVPRPANDDIRALNHALAEICTGRCHFVDVASRLTEPDGDLAPAYREADGIHLNAAGYRILKETVGIAMSTANEN